MNLPQLYSSILILISILIFSNCQLLLSESLKVPIYEYLKDLCPIGQLPLTNKKTVKTCSSLCPLGAKCHKGICCVTVPQCRHPSYRKFTGFPCLLNAKNNCPDGSQCVASSQDGMFVCCTTKNHENGLQIPKITFKKSGAIENNSLELSANSETSVCPATHPVIARDGKSLVLCKDCKEGICSRFRKSSVEVCCQSSDDICGPGSQVLMEGSIPRYCSKKSCGKGFECSLTTYGSRVCCSLARCPSGVFARSVCAAGCLLNEKCVSIQNEMWCCPLLPEVRAKEMDCPMGGVSTGEKCDSFLRVCSNGATCQRNNQGTAHICCKQVENKKYKNRTILKTTTTQATTTEKIESILHCHNGSEPLFHNGLSVMCPRVGEKCPRDGYTCEKSDIEDVFICCKSTPTELPSLEKTTIRSITEPQCPFSYNASIRENGEIQRCLTLFSLDCPFGYTCLPSSTTDSYLCCIRKPFLYK